MTITARSITTNNTLEQLRNQFNNLVADVDGLETGTKAFSTITATDTNTTTLSVLEDGTIVFEGATDDGNETTLTVVDPTADRTISLPNASGTVIVSDSSTNVTTLPDDLLIKDGGTIGNASVADVMTLAATGIVTFKDDLLIKDGGTIGSASSTSAITIASSGIVTFVDDILIKDGGTIGSASSTSAITIASTGIVTFVDDILIKDGRIVEISENIDLGIEKNLDAKNAIVTPGFIDSHTHPIFGGNRSNEYIERLEGSTYDEIKKMEEELYLLF